MIPFAEFSINLNEVFFNSFTFCIFGAFFIFVGYKIYKSKKEFGNEDPSLVLSSFGYAIVVDDSTAEHRTTAKGNHLGYPVEFFISKLAKVSERGRAKVIGCSLTLKTSYAFPPTEVLHNKRKTWVSPFSVAEGGLMEIGRIKLLPWWNSSPVGVHAYGEDFRFLEALSFRGALQLAQKYPDWAWALRPDGRVEVMLYKANARWNRKTVPDGQALTRELMAIISTLKLPKC